MWLHEIVPGTPEADALARKILTSLAEIYASEHGYELESITIIRKDRASETNT